MTEPPGSQSTSGREHRSHPPASGLPQLPPQKTGMRAGIPPSKAVGVVQDLPHASTLIGPYRGVGSSAHGSDLGIGYESNQLRRVSS
jgi:hypothetical protein